MLSPYHTKASAIMSYMTVELEQVAEIVKAAGKLILKPGQTESTDKTNVKDFVTVADINAQDLLRKRLNQLYPDILVLSEEDSQEEQAKLYASDFTGFVLDPIDGTYSFKRDMRESAVSVGYIQSGQPRLGAIYDPYKDELYTVEKGKGAFRNGQPVHVSAQKSLEGASVAISNSYDDAEMARNLKRQLGIYEQSGIMPWTPSAGSVVLTLTYIACGRFDALHHNSLKPWDNAAAFLLVIEAGGVVLRLNGEPAKFTDAAVVAGTPILVKTLIGIFSKLPKELLK